MGLFDFVGKKQQVSLNGRLVKFTVYNPYDLVGDGSQGFSLKGWDDPETVTDLRDLLQNMDSGAVPTDLYKGWGKLAVDFIADQIAKTKVTLYRGDKPVEDRKDYVYRLLKEPMSTFSFSLWLRLVSINLIAYGYVAIQILPEDKSARPIGLRILPSSKVQVRQSTINPYVVEHVTYGGRKLDLERVILVAQFGLDRRFRSDLQNAAYPIKITEGLNKWMYSFIKKGGIIPFVVMVEEDISADEAELLKTKLKQQYAGEDKGFDFIVVNSKIKVEKIGMAPADVDLSKLHKFYRDMVLNLFGIGRFSVGEPENSNRATAAEERKRLHDFVVYPRVKMIMDAIQAQLLDRYFHDYRIAFEIPLVEEDKLDKARYYQIAGAGQPWMTPNEIRQELGYEPVPGGDELLTFDGEPQTKGQKVKKKINREQLEKAIGFSYGEILGVRTRDEYRGVHKKFSKKLERRLVLMLREYSERLREKFRKSLEGKSLIKVKSLQSWFVPQEEMREMQTILEEYFKYVLPFAQEWVKTELGKDYDVPYGLGLEQLLQEVIKRDAEIITRNTDKKIAQVIEQGLKEQLSIHEIAELIEQKVITPIGYRRARVIARTETGKVLGAAKHDLYQRYGVSTREWVAVHDHRTRMAHILADGQRRRMDEPFEVGGEKLMHPGDPKGSPENVINCRCTERATL